MSVRVSRRILSGGRRVQVSLWGLVSFLLLMGPAYGQWESTTSMPEPRFGHASTVLPDGTVLVVGGESSGDSIYASTLIYSPTAKTWTAAGPLPAGRSMFPVVQLPGGKVLASGGTWIAFGAGGYWANSSSAAVYNPVTKTWSATASMSKPRFWHTLTLLPTGKVLAVGDTTVCELYDPSTGTWSATGSLAAQRGAQTATLLPSGKVLVVGGANPTGSSGALATCEIYDPATGSWTSTGSMKTPRTEHAAVLLPSGKVMAIGGYTPSKGPIAEVEIYDPAAGTWSDAAPMAIQRQHPRALLLADGRVLVTGGLGFGMKWAQSTSEIYDPATGEWLPAEDLLNIMSRHHSMNLLPNGSVLLAGGQLTSSAETHSFPKPEAPNLVISAFTAEVSGTNVIYHLTVSNTGTTSAGPFWISVYDNPVGTPAAGTFGDQNHGMSGMAAGASSTVDLTWTGGLAALPATSFARVDSTGIVAESSDTDNLAGPLLLSAPPVAPPPSLPNLVITDFTFEISVLDVIYHVTVANIGTAPAGFFYVDVYRNPSAAPVVGTIGEPYKSLPGLAAGASTKVDLTAVGAVSSLPAMSYARVDTDGIVAETNEADNLAGPMAIPAPASLPNLVISSFTAGVVGADVVYSVVVSNIGTVGTGAFSIDVWFNPSFIPPAGSLGNETTFITSLAPGATATSTLTYVGGASALPITSYARVDSGFFTPASGGMVPESNETDNLAGPLAISAPPVPPPALPNLTITAFTAGVSGANVIYHVTVANTGAAGAGVVVLSVYDKPSTAPAPGTSGDQTVILPTLAAGASTTADVTWVGGASALPATSYARVDTAGIVAETSETDNLAGPLAISAPVVPPPPPGTPALPNLVISSFTSALVGTDVIYTVVVSNIGTAALTGAVSVDVWFNLGAPPPHGTYGNVTDFIVHGLGVGASETLTVTYAGGASALPITSWAVVDNGFFIPDPVGMVPESNETDNLAGPLFVVPATFVPNLKVSAFSAAVAGGNVVYTVTVSNTGTAAVTGAFSVDLWFNLPTAPAPKTLGDKTEFITGLAAGATKTLSVTYTGGAAALPITSWAVVDNGFFTPAPGGMVPESNEADNVAGPLAVSATGTPPPALPNLTISAFSAELSAGNVIYHITVSNTGAGSAGTFYVDLYRNPSAAPAAGSIGDQYEAVTGVAAGATSTVLLTWTGGVAGLPVTSYARVDTHGVVAETSDADNLAGPLAVSAPTTPPTGTPGLNLAVKEFSYVASSTSVLFTVTYTNKGTVTSGTLVVSVFTGSATPPASSKVFGTVSEVDAELAPGMTKSMTLLWTGAVLPTTAYAKVYGGSSEVDPTDDVVGPLAVVAGGSGSTSSIAPPTGGGVPPSEPAPAPSAPSDGGDRDSKKRRFCFVGLEPTSSSGIPGLLMVLLLAGLMGSASRRVGLAVGGRRRGSVRETTG